MALVFSEHKFYVISSFFCFQHAEDSDGTRHRLYAPRFRDGRSFWCPNFVDENVELGTDCVYVQRLSLYRRSWILERGNFW